MGKRDRLDTEGFITPSFPSRVWVAYERQDAYGRPVGRVVSGFPSRGGVPVGRGGLLFHCPGLFSCLLGP